MRYHNKISSKVYSKKKKRGSKFSALTFHIANVRHKRRQSTHPDIYLLSADSKYTGEKKRFTMFDIDDNDLKWFLYENKLRMQGFKYLKTLL